MKIALVSTGLGRVLRGFESFIESFFQTLRRYSPHINVLLIHGGGRHGERHVVHDNDPVLRNDLI
jgi:hypothetical protein